MLVEGGWTLPARVEERAIRNPVAVTSRPTAPLPGTHAINSGLASPQDREPGSCPLA